jgi:DNA-binding MarR family transcriptional regulator
MGRRELVAVTRDRYYQNNLEITKAKSLSSPMPTSRVKPLDVERLKRDEGYALDEDIGYLLARGFTEAHRNLYRRLADLDLTPRQFVVLLKLFEGGEASQNRLGRLAGMKPVTIHGIVQRLTARGFIETRYDESDQRLSLHSLSAAGRAIIPELVRRAKRGLLQTLAPLTDSEQEVLRDLLKKLF